jgi:drug/metabolite transporter (DMT)-like permease
MSVLAIVLTLTPVVTWIWSIALFGGRPSAQEIAGGLATLAGVLVVTSSRARREAPRRRGAAAPL